MPRFRAAYVNLLLAAALHLGAGAGVSVHAAPDDIPPPPESAQVATPASANATPTPARTSADVEKEERAQDKKNKKTAAIVGGGLAGLVIAAGLLSPDGQSEATKRGAAERTNKVCNAGPAGARRALTQPPPAPLPVLTAPAKHRVLDAPTQFPEIWKKLTEAPFPTVCNELSEPGDKQACTQLMGKDGIGRLDKYWAEIQANAADATKVISETGLPIAQEPGTVVDLKSSILKEDTALASSAKREEHEARYVKAVDNFFRYTSAKADAYLALAKTDVASTIQVGPEGAVTGASHPLLNSIYQRFQGEISKWKFKTDVKPPATQAEKKEAERLVKTDVGNLLKKRVVLPEWQVWAAARQFLEHKKKAAEELRIKTEEDFKKVAADKKATENSARKYATDPPPAPSTPSAPSPPDHLPVDSSPVPTEDFGSRNHPITDATMNDTGPNSASDYAVRLGLLPVPDAPTNVFASFGPVVYELRYCPA